MAVTGFPSILYAWHEYRTFLRIVQFGGQKCIQVKRGKRWYMLRSLSDNEYDLCFREQAEQWRRGEIDTVPIP